MNKKGQNLCNKLVQVMEKAEALKLALKELPEDVQFDMAKFLEKRGWVREKPAINELAIIAINIYDASMRQLCDEVGRQIDAENKGKKGEEKND